MCGLTRQDVDYLDGRMSLGDYYWYLQDRCFLKLLGGVVNDATHFYSRVRNGQGKTLKESCARGEAKRSS